MVKFIFIIAILTIFGYNIVSADRFITEKADILTALPHNISGTITGDSKMKTPKRNTIKVRTTRRKDYQRRYYQKNKAKICAYSKLWLARNRDRAKKYKENWKKKTQWFYVYKATLRCEICGYNRCTDAIVFHHKDDSKKCFDVGVKMGSYSRDKIMGEIAKCQALCHNCHAELHSSQKSQPHKIENTQEEIYPLGF